jgi:hypothetical protein
MTIINFIESHKIGIGERSINPEKKSKLLVTFEFNWAWVIFFAFFIAYGYYGALAPGYSAYKTNFMAALGQMAFLCGIQITLGWVAWKKSGYFKDSISIYLRDLLVYTSLLLIGFVLSYERLQYSLFSDEISYAGSAHGHGIHIVLALAKYFPVLGGVTAQYLIQAVSFSMLASVGALIFFSSRWTPKTRIIIFVILLMLGRIVFAIKGGNGSPHPPLHLLPLFLTGSLFGLSDLSFKLSYFLTYAIFLTVLYRMLLRLFSSSVSYITVLAIGTIPLLSYLSTVVEHSFWAFICFTLIFVEIITSPKLNFTRLISFASIAVLMRQPTFLALLPIFLLLVAEIYQLGLIGRWLRSSWVIFLPLLLFLPFLVASLLYGTPSTDALGQGSMLERVKMAAESGVILDSVSRSIPLWWLIFLPFAFVPLSVSTVSRNIGYLLFGIMAIMVYYSINPSLWGYAKYQAEYAAPVVIAGLLSLMARVKQLKQAKFISVTCTSMLLTLNVMELVGQSHLKKIESQYLEKKFNVSLDADEIKHLVAAIPYEYKQAYTFIRQERLDGSTYSIGATYGILPEVMNSLSVQAVRASYDIYTGQETNRLNSSKTSLRIGMIEADYRIQAVMIGAISGKQELIEDFRQRHWKQVAEFKNMQYGTTVLIMRRPAADSVPMGEIEKMQE